MLGNGTTYTPVKLSKMKNVVSVELGYGEVGIICQNGSTWLWGENSHGEIGNGEASSSCVERKLGNDINQISLDGYSSYY